MKYSFFALMTALATPALADGTRELSAHEHGQGTLLLAIDGNAVAMEFRAPGADVVGFEYKAESAEDRAAIDAAVATLGTPLELFVVPQAAQCSVVQAGVQLEAGDHDHGHDDHANHGKDDHGDHGHDDHAQNDAREHEHDHAHETHNAQAGGSEGHTEFHAQYTLECADPTALSEIQFPYFDIFENARALDVQVVTNTGAKAFDVTRADPALDLKGMF